MKTLELKDLFEGVVYWDIIAQRPMLVTSIDKDGDIVDVRGTIFDNGKYHYNMHVADHQLREIKSEEI